MDVRDAAAPDDYDELANELARLAGHAAITPAGIDTSNSYSSGGHAYYGIPVPARRGIARAWLRRHGGDYPEAVLALCDRLFSSAIYEEKTLACMILAGHREARAAATPAAVDTWLDELAGWAEVDSLCQGTFPAEQMLSGWDGWQGLVERLAVDTNINKRRAALVLLTGPVAHSTDARLSRCAFQVIETLQHERPIIITKAVSWLLRSLVRHHREAVEQYMSAHAATLPAIAVRETRMKLATGAKSGGRAPASNAHQS